jgi:hypothetical protein
VALEALYLGSEMVWMEQNGLDGLFFRVYISIGVLESRACITTSTVLVLDFGFWSGLWIIPTGRKGYKVL